MMPLLSALHNIAGQRGDGLRPELVKLLRRSDADSVLIRQETKMAAVDMWTVDNDKEHRRTA